MQTCAVKAHICPVCCRRCPCCAACVSTKDLVALFIEHLEHALTGISVIISVKTGNYIAFHSHLAVFIIPQVLSYKVDLDIGIAPVLFCGPYRLITGEGEVLVVGPCVVDRLDLGVLSLSYEVCDELHSLFLIHPPAVAARIVLAQLSALNGNNAFFGGLELSVLAIGVIFL